MARIPDHRVRALSHHAKRLEEKHGSEAARRLRAEINRLYSGAEALDGVAASRSPLDTDAAHIKKVATVARKFDQEVLAVINRAGQIYRESREAVQRRIDEKVNLKPDAFAQEIRATFRTLNRKDKVQLLGQLVKENRGPELAAIVRAPSILSGISDEERANYERAIIGIHAGPEVAELEDMDAALEESFSATRVATSFASSLINPGKVAAIEQGDAAATAAVEAFNQSIQ